MNKTELISAVSKKTGIRKSDVKMILDACLDTITEELIEEQSVQLTGFGTFKLGTVKEHLGRNPLDSTEFIKIDATKRVYFSAGTKLKRDVNEK